MDRYSLCLYINFILNYSYFKKIVSQTKKKKKIVQTTCSKNYSYQRILFRSRFSINSWLNCRLNRVVFSAELSATLSVVEFRPLDGFGYGFGFRPTNKTFSFGTSEFLLNISKKT